jgi:hypothetical protein
MPPNDMSSHPNLRNLVWEADPPPIDSGEITLNYGQVAVGAMVPGVQGQVSFCDVLLGPH